MLSNHLRIVHLVDVVSGKDKNYLRRISLDEVDVLVNGICSSLIPVRTAVSLERRQDIGTCIVTVKVPGMTVSDVCIKRERLLLGKHAYDLDTRVCCYPFG